MKKYIILALLPILFQDTLHSVDFKSDLNKALASELINAQKAINTNTVLECNAIISALIVFASKNDLNKSKAIEHIKIIKAALEKYRSEQYTTFWSRWFGSNPEIVTKTIDPALTKVNKALQDLQSSSTSYVAKIANGAALTVTAVAIAIILGYSTDFFSPIKNTTVASRPTNKPIQPENAYQSNNRSSLQSYLDLEKEISEYANKIYEIKYKLEPAGIFLLKPGEENNFRSKLIDLELNLTELQEELNSHPMNPDRNRRQKTPQSDANFDKDAFIRNFERKPATDDNFTEKIKLDAENAAYSAEVAARNAEAAAEEATTAALEAKKAGNVIAFSDAEYAAISAIAAAQKAFDAANLARNTPTSTNITAVREAMNAARSATYNANKFAELAYDSIAQNSTLHKSSAYHSDSDDSSTTYDSNSE